GELHARVLEAEALDVGREADRHQHLAGLDRALCAVLAGVGDGDLVARVLDGLDLRAGEDLDAELLVLAGDLLRDIRILVGEGPVEELDDRALHAVVGQHVGELHADGAGADDDDRLGDVAVEDLLLEADHVAAQLDARKQPHLRPGRDDGVVERDLSVEPSALVTVVAFGPVNEPRPSYSVTLFFFMRKWMPLTCVSETLRLRSHAAPKSKCTSPEMPNRSAWAWKMCARSALRSRAFEGMQPTFRQTPPQYFSSMIATDLPSWAARTAATYPPGPAPRMTTS